MCVYNQLNATVEAVFGRYKKFAESRLVRDFPQMSGALAGLFGLLIVISWHAHLRPILQMVPGSAPMQYNTALCLSLLGLGQLLLSSSRLRPAQIPGVIVSLFGLLSLVEYLLGLNLGIDQFFLTPFFSAVSAFPGRMSPLAAGCFTLLGFAIAQLGSRRPTIIIDGLLACIVFVIATVALLGYAFDIDAAYGWGAYSAMAFNTSALFLVISGGIMVTAAQMAKSVNRGFRRWVPVTSSVTLMLMIAFVSVMNRIDLKKATFWRRHTFEVILKAQSFQDNLVSIQRGIRGYALSGDRAALASYEAAVRLEPALLDQLFILTADNPAQQVRLGRLSRSVNSILAYYGKVRAVYEKGGYPAFAKLDALGENRAYTGSERDALNAFSQQEQQLLDVRDLSEERESSNGERLLVFGSVTASGLLIIANFLAGRQMARRLRVEAERERLIGELRQALTQVRTLSGMIPICGWCKSIRTDKGFWQTVEHYVGTHSDATFTHGICPACTDRLTAENKLLSRS